MKNKRALLGKAKPVGLTAAIQKREVVKNSWFADCPTKGCDGFADIPGGKPTDVICDDCGLIYDAVADLPLVYGLTAGRRRELLKSDVYADALTAIANGCGDDAKEQARYARSVASAMLTIAEEMEGA